MQNTIRKRAISGVIASVLLILVAVAAAFLLYTLVKSQINFSPQVSCIDMQISPPVTIEKVCYNQASQDTELTLRRNQDLVDYINLATSGKENSLWRIGQGCANCIFLNANEIKTYYLAEQPEKITLAVPNCVLETQDVPTC